MTRHLAHWEVADVAGHVVAIDVIRAFTTAACAFAAGAREIHLVERLTDAYSLLDAHAPGRAATYVITGRFADAPDTTGDEDLAAAELIDSRRAGAPTPADVDHLVRRVATSPDADGTLGHEHVHPDDLAYCTDVDRFAFAMVTTRTTDGLVLRTTRP